MTATLGAARHPDTSAQPLLGTLSRDNAFDAMRLFAAICVAIQHTVIHLDGNFLWYTADNGLWFPDGVAMFFILSGSMVYASAEKCIREQRPIRAYLTNRVLRIAPAIYAYLLVTVVALLATSVIDLRQLATPDLLLWLVTGLLLAPVYHPDLFHSFGTGYVNGSLWTIPVEFGFYLVVPALVWTAARAGFRRMLAALSIISVLAVLTFAALGGQDTDRLDARVLGATCLPWLGYFAVGIAITRVWRRLPQHWLVVVAATAVYLGCWMWRRSVDPETSMVIAVVAAAIPLAYVTFWVGHHAPAFVRRTTSRIGDLSFGVYIWHMPLINFAIWAGVPKSHPQSTWIVVAILAATLTAALLSWHGVEKPALRLKRYSSRPSDSAR